MYRSWLPGITVTFSGSVNHGASDLRATLNSAGRAVVVRSPVIRMWSGSSESTRFDDLLNSLQPKLTRSLDQQRAHAQESLVEQVKRIEGELPEVDVGDVNEPERAG